MTAAEAAALAAAGVLVATMPVYAVVARGRAVDPDVARRPRTVLLGLWIRDWLMWVIGPIERACVAARVPPVAFNWAGVAFGALAGVAYAGGALGTGGWMVLLGGAADVLDGRIARARGMVSDAGAFLDSTLDRFAETFAFVGIALWFAPARGGVLAAVLALGGSLLVSYARARGEGLGVLFKGGLMQRAERLVLLALASLLDAPVGAALGVPHGALLFAALLLIAVLSLGTALYRTVAIARALDEKAGR
jgi:phosphatidylglycerophosphate synthase